MGTNVDLGGLYYQPWYLPSQKLVSSYTTGDLRLTQWFDGGDYPVYINGILYNQNSTDFYVFKKYFGNSALNTSDTPNSGHAVKPFMISEMYLIAVEPQTGVLTFSNSSESSIRVNVVDHDGEINNAANFTIRLVSADSGFTLGGLRETRVTIQDADNPLAHLYGTYRSGTLTDLWGAETSLELVISAVDGSTTEVSIEGLAPTAASYGLTLEPVIGSVSGNLMTLASEQTLASTEGLGVAGDEIFFSSISTFTSSGFNWGTALVFTIDEDAMTLTAAPFGYGIAYLAENFF